MHGYVAIALGTNRLGAPETTQYPQHGVTTREACEAFLERLRENCAAHGVELRFTRVFEFGHARSPHPGESPR